MRHPAVIAIVMLLVLAGPAASATTTDVAAVSATGWSPDPVTIHVGDSVSWSNATGFAHNVCVAGAGAAAGTNCSEFQAPASPSANWGGAETHIFNAAGTFHYECQLHTNMRGTITVLGGPAAIAGAVWDDANGSRAHDAGEASVAGVTVALTPQGSGTPSATTQTAADGSYSFANVSAGSYGVTEQTPAGYGATATTTRFVDLNGTDLNGADFFIAHPTASIAGRVWDDANGNGAADSGEAGLADVTVFDDANRNGVPDAGETAQQTASDGGYVLHGLLPGSRSFSYVVPAGRANTGLCPVGVALTEDQAATRLDFFTRTTPVTSAGSGGTSAGSGSGAQQTPGSAATPSPALTDGSNPSRGARATGHCVVPRLRGLTLRRAQRALLRARCRLGRVRKVRARGGSGRVVAQSPYAGARRPLGARVAVSVVR